MTAFALDSATNVTVDVCIPWRAQPDRLAAFDRVMEWWADLGFRPILADSDPDYRFNLSQARNAAVAQSSAEVVIVADADTIPDAKALLRAIRRARYNRVVYPFDRYVYLAPGQEPGGEPERSYTHSFGGLMVLKRSLYWDLGGHDEKFRQWGFEDTAFQLVAETLASTERVPGTVYAYNHSAERDMTTSNPGRARVALYRFARRDAAVMRELIS